MTNKTLNEIDWYSWFFTIKYYKELKNFEDALEKFLKKEIDENLEAKFNNWILTSKVIFINLLEQRYEFLIVKLNEFFKKY